MNNQLITKLLEMLLDNNSSNTESLQKDDIVNTDKVFEIGKNYFIRTATSYFVGNLKNICKDYIILSQASYIGNTGKFSDALREGLEKVGNSEIEPYVNDVIINKGAMVDATIYNHKLPKNKK